MPTDSDLSRRPSSLSVRAVLRGLVSRSGFGNFKRKSRQSITNELITRPLLIPSSSWQKRTLFVPARKSGPGAFYQLTTLRKISSRSRWVRFFQACAILSLALLLIASVLAALAIRSLDVRLKRLEVGQRQLVRLLLSKRETGDLI